jgi:V8-like Glu-specific endopeptidase
LPSINGCSLGFEEAHVGRWRFPDDYKKELNSAEDFGILFLDSPIGKYTGNFGIGCLTDSQIEKLTINVTGYPGDKVETKPNDYEMWGMPGKVRKLDDDFLYYDIDTCQG